MVTYLVWGVPRVSMAWRQHHTRCNVDWPVPRKTVFIKRPTAWWIGCYKRSSSDIALILQASKRKRNQIGKGTMSLQTGRLKKITRCTRGRLRNSGAQATIRRSGMLYQLPSLTVLTMKRSNPGRESIQGRIIHAANTYYAARKYVEQAALPKIEDTTSRCSRRYLDGGIVVHPKNQI